MRGGDGVPWRRFFWDFLLFQAGGIAPLVALARDGSDGQMKKNATDALWNLALNADNILLMKQLGYGKKGWRGGNYGWKIPRPLWNHGASLW